MKTTHKWLESLVPTGLKPQELADVLTFSGLEVEHLSPLPNGDTQFHIEVTSNRVDGLGVAGLARDISAVREIAVQWPAVNLVASDDDPKIAVSIDEQALAACPHYTARVIAGIKVGPSPAWLAERLTGIGLATVNNVVDVTNLVMFELGQPLHAFDLDKLSGRRIRVRMAQEGEQFTAINHRSYKLSPSDLVIADGSRAVALAGIMGGLDSEISADTVNVLLESAWFEPQGVKASGRRMDQQHSDNLESDSRYRFERGTDPAGVIAASNRAASLIAELCGGIVVGELVAAGTPAPAWLGTVSLRLAEVARVMGAAVEAKRAAKILTALGCLVEASDAKTITVKVPSFRRDLEREIDLVEEVARVVGLNNFQPRVSLSVAPSRPTRATEVADRARELLLGLGFDETLTDTFVAATGASLLTPWQDGGSPVEARNPVNSAWPAIRRTVMPSLLRVLGLNARHGNRGLRLQEQAQVTLLENGKPAERSLLAVCAPDFATARGAIETLVSRLRVTGIEWRRADLPLFAAGRGAEVVVTVAGKARRLAVCGEASESALQEFDLDDRPGLAEVDLEVLADVAGGTAMMQSLPRFPEVVRDLALILPEEVEWATVAATARNSAGERCREVRFFDEFRGKQIPKGRKSLAFSLRFRDDQRTLVSGEVDQWVADVVAALKSQHGAELRG